MKVLVTGATGFIGQALIENLLLNSCEVRVLVRDYSAVLPFAVERVVMGDLMDLTLSNSSNVLRSAFKGIDTVVAAARAHVMNDIVSNPLDEFRKVNLNATMVLARLSAEAGVNVLYS